MATFADLRSALETSSAVSSWSGLTFTQFCRRLGVKLEPGQLAFALVAYDGKNPRDLTPKLQRIARLIFGPVDAIPKKARRVVCIVAGARGGKSYIMGALRLLHLALTVPIGSLASGEEAFGVIMSADPRQRAQCYSYARGAVEAHPELLAMVDGRIGAESFTLRRPDGKVTIESIPPKRGGGSGRGRALVGAVLEECAFFLPDEYQVSDEEAFRAVTPRILPGGQTILSSTPWAEAGLLYKEFVDNHPEPKCAAPHLTTPGKPHRAIAAHAPTLLLRDVALTREIVEAETVRDPENAAREYGAQFLALGTTVFFDSARIAAAVNPKLELGAPASKDPRAVRVLGLDLGFVRDAATGVPCERDPEKYRVLDYVEIIPAREKLKPSEVLGRIAEKADAYGIGEAIGDQHYAETAKEAFYSRPRPLVWIDRPGGAQGKTEIFQVTREILNEGLLELPNDPRLLEQLRSVQKKPLPGGGLAIDMPRSRSGHGDVVAGLVCAIWYLHRLTLAEAPEQLPERGPSREAYLWQRRIDENIAADERRAAMERLGFLPPGDE